MPLLGTMLCCTVPVFGQSQLEIFKNPVRQAVQYNKEVQNTILTNQKTALDREDLKGKLLPTVSANAMYGYVNTGFNLDLPTQTLPFTGLNLFEGSTNGNMSSQIAIGGLTATQVIFSGLQISNGLKALEQKYKAQNLLAEASYDQIAQDVLSSFDQLMLLKEVDLLIDDSEKRLNREHLKVIKAIENGVAIPYDRDKIKLAMLELESKREEVKSGRELLYFRLQEITGMPMESLHDIAYTLQPLHLDENSFVMNRKELQALEASGEAYKYVLKKEQGAKLPMVFAFVNASYINAFDTRMTVKDLPLLDDLKFRSNHLQLAPSFAIGVGAKWTIFEGNTHKIAIEKAKLDLQINENKLKDTKDKLSLLQRKTKSDYLLFNKKLGINEQQMTIAKNNLILASRQFEEGLLDVTERLQAENEFYKQSLSYFNQVLNQRQAASEVLKSNGNLYQTIIQ